MSGDLLELLLNPLHEEPSPARILVEVATGIGLDAGETRAAWEDAEKLKVLDDNWAEAQELGLIGVPSVQIGEELFWGSDRLEYIVDHLTALRARRV